MVIVPLRCVNSNILIGKTHYSGNIELLDPEYLRFCVRKLLENNAMNGRNKTLAFCGNRTLEMCKLEYFDWKDSLFGKYWTAGHGVFTISCPEVR